MSAPIPRLRMFPGPNGSGKSTLKSYLHPKLLGVYLNPDEIEQEIRKQGFLDFASYSVNTTADEALPFFSTSKVLQQARLSETARELTFAAGRLDFAKLKVNSYFASVVGDFLRRKLLAQKFSFTFETVMSHPSKVDVLVQAQAAGFRTYLYFVATDDPTINISRVRNRVALKGHDVPEDKIVTRYHRSLDLEKETAIFSSPTSIYLNKDYMVITAKGIENPKEIVPLILNRLLTKGGDWFFALESIAGENPARDIVNYPDAVKAWEDWAKKQGFTSNR